MPAESALTAAIVTVVVAAVARLVGAVSTSGAAAGCLVGGAIAVGAGLPGLAPLGAFFVLGSLATRVGYGRKAEKGTAERSGGARGAARVMAKGGVAAVAALWPAPCAFVAMSGALAAALADTLGTEIGTLARGEPRLLPTFRRVPAGTPGAVSLPGTLGSAAGAALVAAAAAAAALHSWEAAAWVSAAGLVGALLESLLGGALPAFARLPGTVRNVVTTAAGATLAALFAPGGLL
jgi:uncharacterized protein (TIGR00297 family)